MPFGGFFEIEHTEFKGLLADRCGLSEIIGSIAAGESEISFDKFYTNGRKLISYSFRKEGDLWVGEYNGRDCGRGKAIAKIVPVEFNFRDVQRYSLSNEEIAKDMIEKMKSEGYITEQTDPQTGEKVFIQTEVGKKVAEDFERENPAEARELERRIEEQLTDNGIPF